MVLSIVFSVHKNKIVNFQTLGDLFLAIFLRNDSAHRKLDDTIFFARKSDV